MSYKKAKGDLTEDWQLGQIIWRRTGGIQYAAKELSRGMAKPTVGHWTAMKGWGGIFWEGLGARSDMHGMEKQQGSTHPIGHRLRGMHQDPEIDQWGSDQARDSHQPDMEYNAGSDCMIIRGIIILWVDDGSITFIWNSGNSWGHGHRAGHPSLPRFECSQGNLITSRTGEDETCGSEATVATRQGE